MISLNPLNTERESPEAFWVDEAWEVDGAVSDSTEMRKYDGEAYYCQIINSNDDTWVLSYGKSIESNDNRVFLFHLNELVLSSTVESPIGATVTNDGVFCLITKSKGKLGGKLSCFSKSGEEILTHTFESNLEALNVDSEGTLLAVTTRPPDNRLDMFDLENCKKIVKIENPVDRVSEITVYRKEHEVVFLVYNETGEPKVAIDANGDLIWDDRGYVGRQNTILDRLKNLF